MRYSIEVKSYCPMCEKMEYGVAVEYRPHPYLPILHNPVVCCTTCYIDKVLPLFYNGN